MKGTIHNGPLVPSLLIVLFHLTVIGRLTETFLKFILFVRIDREDPVHETLLSNFPVDG